MPEFREEQEISSKPLPKELQSLVDKDDADKQTRSDYENSWTAV